MGYDLVPWQEQLAHDIGAVDANGRGINGPVREVNSRAYCSWFNFSGADQSRKVGFSPGSAGSFPAMKSRND